MSSFNPFGKKDEKAASQVAPGQPPSTPKQSDKEKTEQKKLEEETKDQNPDNKPTEVKPATADAKAEICQMKRGDYMIHVFIEQAKNIKIDSESTVDPLVEIKCLNERKFTTAQDDINNTSVAIWNEHVFFEPKNLETEDLESAKIQLKLMDKGYFKDSLIGYYEFDLSYLYQQQDHALMHKWIVMSNPESENFGEVTAQLKISVTICGEGDEQVGIQDDPHPEREDIIQPPQIKPKFFQLRFRFFTGQKIVPMDKAILRQKPKTDAYIRLDYKTTRLKSSVQLIEEGGECSWNQEFLVPAQIPIIGGRITFKLYDEDTVSDEIIGTILFDLKDIIPDPNGVPGRFNGSYDWKNVYGAPVGCSGKITDKMNLNPELASFWKGRILVQAVCEETEKPLLLVKKLEPDVIDQAKPYQQNRSYAFSIFLAGAIGCPIDDHEFYVSVRVGDKEWKSKPPKFKKSKYNRYNELLTEGEREVRLPYQSIQDIGTIFIYLNDTYKIGKDKRICFWKGSIMEFTNPNPKLKWIELEPDLAIGEVKEHYKASIIGLKIAVHDISKDGPIDWLNYPTWNEKINRRPAIIKVRVFCWQARDLPAADESGSSDPFIQITDSDKTQNTAVIWDNVNPLFYQGIDATYECNTQQDLPPVIIDVFDKDESIVGKDGEDFLARALIKVQDEEYSEGNSIPQPKWYKIYYKKNGPPSGEVLLSFAIVADDYNFKKTIDKLKLEKEVEMKEFGVQMNILGLRGLQSPGLLPVKKAFLQFNLKSMVPPRLGTDLSNIKTEPKMAGSDPTLNTLIEFSAPLPIKELFCPRMSCSVFDNIAMGLSQPLIGTFVIPIGDLMHSLIKERTEETEALEKVVDQIKRFVNGEMIAASMRSMVKAKKLEEDKKLEEELMEVRAKQALKDKIAKGFHSSVNESSQQYDAPLLTGDYSEDVRQAERIQEEQKAGVEGSNERLGKDVLEQIINSRTGSVRRTGSINSVNSDDLINNIQKFDPKLKAQLLEHQAHKVERARRDNEEQRKKAEAAFNNVENLIMPKYKHDDLMDVDREHEIPPEAMFIGLGWDENAETGRKHYRRFYPDELEKIKSILPIETPFNQYDIKRGQTRGAKVSFWANLTNNVKQDGSGSASTEKIVGRFKAVIEVEAKEEKKIYLEKKKQLFDDLIAGLRQLAKNRKIQDFDLDLEKLETMEGRQQIKQSLDPLQVNYLNIVEKLADIESDVILKRMLLKSNKMIVRVYMIEGFDLASRDIGGFSDPYLRLKCGSKQFDERKNYVLDEPNPKFCKNFDFETVFPGCPMLFIEAMDYDELFGDDLIGSCTVDLEDRYFLPEWRALRNIPVEYRQIYHPSSNVSQGQLKMWVEINPANVEPEKRAKLWDIRPKPPQEYQLRLCVFNTKEIKMMDAEGTSDVYIRAFFDSRKDALETDTHYRCQTGDASFNYRLNFKLEYPRKDYHLTVQAYDRDFFKSNDVIGSTMLDLKTAFGDVDLTKRPLRIDKKYHDEYMKKEGDTPLEWDKEGESFWLPMLSKNNEGVIETNGYVRVRIDITSMEWAEKTKIGSARDEPNMEPYLPPPVGRLHFSMNPCEMYKQLIGPTMRRKIAIWCCIGISTILCCMILYYLVPIVLGDLISRWIIKI